MHSPNSSSTLWPSPAVQASGLVAHATEAVATQLLEHRTFLNSTGRHDAVNTVYEHYSPSIIPGNSTTSAIRGTLDDPAPYHKVNEFERATYRPRETFHYFAATSPPGARHSPPSRVIAALPRRLSAGDPNYASLERVASSSSPSTSTSSFPNPESQWCSSGTRFEEQYPLQPHPVAQGPMFGFPDMSTCSLSPHASFQPAEEWRKRRYNYGDEYDHSVQTHGEPLHPPCSLPLPQPHRILFADDGGRQFATNRSNGGLPPMPSLQRSASSGRHEHLFTPPDFGPSKHRRLSLAEYQDVPQPHLPRRDSAPTVSFSRGAATYRAFEEHSHSQSSLFSSPPHTPPPNYSPSSSQVLPSPFYDSSAPTSPESPYLGGNIGAPLPAPSSAGRPTSYPQETTDINRTPPDSDFTESDNVRQQKLRFEEDHYTPLWIRKQGHAREGWCALCPGDGKWLQLKNSQFWYHRQFQHGVSSVSGHYFLPPVETRPGDEGSGHTLGLCHSCGDWVPYQNSRGGSSQAKGPTLWYRHAHGCHSYFSPKREATKQVRMMGHRG